MSHSPPSLMATTDCHGFGNNQVIYLFFQVKFLIMILNFDLYNSVNSVN